MRWFSDEEVVEIKNRIAGIDCWGCDRRVKRGREFAFCEECRVLLYVRIGTEARALVRLAGVAMIGPIDYPFMDADPGRILLFHNGEKLPLRLPEAFKLEIALLESLR